jgi:signal transduction histidine kinase
MVQRLIISLCLCSFICATAIADDHTAQQARAEWRRLKQLPVTATSFHAVCDLIQDIAHTDLNQAYEILAGYTPIVRAAGNRAWLHVLLMTWARGKESTDYFGEADTLYRAARENAVGNPHLYDEAMVGSVLMYAEWGKEDSARKYAAAGKEAARNAADIENLSFLYTFGALTDPNDTAAMGASLRTAIVLASGLSDKNALFTARYNYAVIYGQHDPQRQVAEFESLLELSNDSSLNRHPRLYERTSFSFRNPAPSIYYQLMQVNLLLTDYDNAWKFAELFYNATVKPNPLAAQAAFFNAEMAIVKAYQGDYLRMKAYLEQSLALFHLPEDQIPYTSYFLAAGMLAEHDQQYGLALHYYETAYKKGSTEGLHLMQPGIYYAHGLIISHQLKEAEKVLEELRTGLPSRTWTAYGYYYYKDLAELLKAEGNNPGYGKALETFYAIKDSLTSLNHYRAIQEIEARVRLHDKEQQIARLNQENSVRLEKFRRDRIYFVGILGVSVLIILLLAGYARYMRLQSRMEIMRGAIDAEENERRKIADQLHEDIGTMLSLATLNLSAVLEKGGQLARSGEQLVQAKQILDTVGARIRDLSHQLTPLVIEKFGFRAAVEDMVHAINLSGKLKLDLIVLGWKDKDNYPISFLNDLYRIVQELLHNILKHAGASAASLELIEHEKLISVIIEDNGIGVPETMPVKGKGIATIRSKIAYLKGLMEVSRKINGGTLIVIELPHPMCKRKDMR